MRFSHCATVRILNRIRTSGCVGRVSTAPFYCNVIAAIRVAPWPPEGGRGLLAYDGGRKQYPNVFLTQDFTDSGIRTMRLQLNFVLLRPTSLTAFEIVDSEVLLIGA